MRATNQVREPVEHADAVLLQLLVTDFHEGLDDLCFRETASPTASQTAFRVSAFERGLVFFFVVAASFAMIAVSFNGTTRRALRRWRRQPGCGANSARQTGPGGTATNPAGVIDHTSCRVSYSAISR